MKTFQANIQEEKTIKSGPRKGEVRKSLTIWKVSASNVDAAKEKAELFSERNPIFGALLSVTETTLKDDIKLVPDAEKLLFELDASGADAIAVRGGMNNKQVTYTRKQIEDSVYAEISEVTHEFNFASGVHKLREI